VFSLFMVYATNFMMGQNDRVHQSRGENYF
jgi:hypothetical protein